MVVGSPSTMAYFSKALSTLLSTQQHLRAPPSPLRPPSTPLSPMTRLDEVDEGAGSPDGLLRVVSPIPDPNTLHSSPAPNTPSRRSRSRGGSGTSTPTHPGSPTRGAGQISPRAAGPATPRRRAKSHGHPAAPISAATGLDPDGRPLRQHPLLARVDPEDDSGMGEDWGRSLHAADPAELLDDGDGVVFDDPFGILVGDEDGPDGESSPTQPGASDDEGEGESKGAGRPESVSADGDATFVYDDVR